MCGALDPEMCGALDPEMCGALDPEMLPSRVVPVAVQQLSDLCYSLVTWICISPKPKVSYVQ